MRDTRKKIYRLASTVLLAGWMTIIFLFSAQPAGESSKVSGGVAYRIVSRADRIFGMDLREEELLRYTQKLDHPIRKAAHMSEYAVLGMAAFLFFAGRGRKGRKCYVFSLLFSAVYAATDEIHQLFVPGRAGRCSDVVIDTLGAAAGLLVLWILGKICASRLEKSIHKPL